jgi:hypothetical protein
MQIHTDEVHCKLSNYVVYICSIFLKLMFGFNFICILKEDSLLNLIKFEYHFDFKILCKIFFNILLVEKVKWKIAYDYTEQYMSCNYHSLDTFVLNGYNWKCRI